MADLKQFESGIPVNDICLQVGVSPATFCKWKAKYGDLEASELSCHRNCPGKKVLNLDQKREVVTQLVEVEFVPAKLACATVSRSGHAEALANALRDPDAWATAGIRSGCIAFISCWGAESASTGRVSTT